MRLSAREIFIEKNLKLDSFTFLNFIVVLQLIKMTTLIVQGNVVALWAHVAKGWSEIDME